jgi:AcrR family transcriptional regulator
MSPQLLHPPPGSFPRDTLSYVIRPSGTRRPVATETLAPIVAAARQCFAQLGVQRTRMEDVASGAGMSRQGLYRYVSGRDDLVELAIMARCSEFAATLIAGTPDHPSDVIETMVDLTLRMVTLARDDEEFSYLAEATPRVRLNLLLASANSPMHALVSSCFEPLLTQAEGERLLRTDATRREMTEWIQGLLTVLTPRIDQGASEQRRYIRQFGIRGLLR